jgi:hypothetical protein
MIKVKILKDSSKINLAFIALALGLLSPFIANAQHATIYPQKPIKILVGLFLTTLVVYSLFLAYASWQSKRGFD